MNMDFKSAKELLDLCEENQLPISEVMRQRECLLGEVPRDAVDHRMAKAWEIMHASATPPRSCSMFWPGCLCPWAPCWCRAALLPPSR